jgi:hypothetical protein
MNLSDNLKYLLGKNKITHIYKSLYMNLKDNLKDLLAKNKITQRQLVSSWTADRNLPTIEIELVNGILRAEVKFEYWFKKKSKKLGVGTFDKFTRVISGKTDEVRKVAAKEASRISPALATKFNDEYHKTLMQTLNKPSKNKSVLNLGLYKNNEYGIYDVESPASLLNAKIKQSDMSLKDLEVLSGVDKSTLFRHLKGTFEISRDAAIKYAKALGCDPAEILFNDLSVPVWGSTNTISSSLLKRVIVDHHEITANSNLGIVRCPREIYRPDVKAIKIDSPSSHLHNHIAFYYSTNETKNYENQIVILGAYIKDRSDGEPRARYYIGVYKKNYDGKSVDLHIIDPEAIQADGIIPDEDFNTFDDFVGAVEADRIIVQGLDPLFVAPVVSFIDPLKVYSNQRVEVQKHYKDIYTDSRIEENLNYKNFKEIQKMSYLKLKLKDYLKTIDTDDMTTLSIQQRIKNLINVSGNIQDTIGRAAYGEAKFEKKIFPIKDKNIIKADFTPEEIKELDKKFERIIEQAETPTNKDEDFNG